MRSPNFLASRHAMDGSPSKGRHGMCAPVCTEASNREIAAASRYACVLEPASPLRSERLDDAALGDRALSALIDQFFQLPAQNGEIGDLALDFRQMLTCTLISKNLPHG